MVAFNVRGVLLDIEGTTSSISFVYDSMFPYVRQHLISYLDSNWGTQALNKCVPMLASDIGQDVDRWLGDKTQPDQRELVAQAVVGLMDEDVKATGLKQLQGLIWKDGFHSGQLVAHLFEDVPTAIHQWKAAGLDIRVYSSGSTSAQELFFGHTVAGDLRALFSGHYDTTTGPKKASSSYEIIAKDFRLPPKEILFVSDVVDELKAAAQAGFETVLSVRTGNPPANNRDGFKEINSFSDLKLV